MPLASLQDIRLGREYLARFAKLNVPEIDVRKLNRRARSDARRKS